MIELLKYHIRIYFRSNKLIMPLLLWLSYMTISYSQMPITYAPSIVMSAGVLFFIMTWISFNCMEMEDPVSEQLIMLKVRNIHLYHMSKILFVILIGDCMSFIGILYPFLKDIGNGFFFFVPAVRLTDILYGYLLHLLLALLGVLLGAIFHPRIVKNRKLALLTLISIALLSYTKGPIHEELPISRWITWVFPPVYNVMESFNGMTNFSGTILLLPFFYVVIYGSIFSIFLLYLLKRNKF